jgi:integrase/recombinase XerD
VKIALRKKTTGPGPRLHDFRHRFAVQTMIDWYRSGEDVERRLPILSAFLGHVSVDSTYWYLTEHPELMRMAVHRLENRWEGRR